MNNKDVVTEKDIPDIAKYMQQICNEMDRKTKDFMKFQREYHMNQVDSSMLVNKTTQPFWQSMRLSKRRLESKGLSMDVEISQDSKSKTIKDERLHMRKEGHHLVGNKMMNVIAHRTFYREGKEIQSVKSKEICSLSMLKTEVYGDRATCPNCGNVGTISSFIDGCDACDSKFTVHDFETKVSGFSLEENTSAKIKDTVVQNAKRLGIVLAILMLICVVGVIVLSVWMLAGEEGKDIMNLLIPISVVVRMIPIIRNTIFVLGVVFIAGTVYLMSVYKKRTSNEAMVKQVIPNFSEGDFYQNLEYKLRNIHLTDRAEEVNVFARCQLNQIITDYKNVVDCDMTRLRFLNLKKVSDGYKLDVKVDLRLTEYNKNRIFTNYEKVNLVLFGKPEVIGKSITTLHQYTCPGCGASINILEGGKCSYCGNIFDYSQFGWVIESYKNIRKKVHLFNLIKYTMITLFIIVFSVQMIFPGGFGQGNTVKMYQYLIETVECAEQLRDSIKKPHELYDNIQVDWDVNWLFSHEWEYTATDAEKIVTEYRNYLEENGLQLYKETENTYVMYKVVEMPDMNQNSYTCYHCIIVTIEGNKISIEEVDADALERTLE